MMISKTEINQVIREYSRQTTVDAAGRTGAAENVGTDKRPRNKATAVKPQSDQVDVSSLAHEVAKVKEAIKSLPDVRADKVAALKEQVAAGRYHVPAADIAEQMIGRNLADRIK